MPSLDFNSMVLFSGVFLIQFRESSLFLGGGNSFRLLWGLKKVCNTFGSITGSDYLKEYLVVLNSMANKNAKYSSWWWLPHGKIKKQKQSWLMSQGLICPSPSSNEASGQISYETAGSHPVERQMKKAFCCLLPRKKWELAAAERASLSPDSCCWLGAWCWGVELERESGKLL